MYFLPRVLFFQQSFIYSKVTIHKREGIIRTRLLFEGGSQLRKYGIDLVLPLLKKVHSLQPNDQTFRWSSFQSRSYDYFSLLQGYQGVLLGLFQPYIACLLLLHVQKFPPIAHSEIYIKIKLSLFEYLWAVHKLCQKLPILLSKKTIKRGEGVKNHRF